jgi:peptidyl-tRNA hydrolase, PTH2 family
MCAQCCHAAVGIYGEIIFGKNEKFKKWLNKWEDEATAKVALKVDSEKELLELQKEAEKLGLPNYLVMDAGRTQIEAGSKTVLSIGPAPISEIDKVTKHLKLL